MLTRRQLMILTLSFSTVIRTSLTAPDNLLYDPAVQKFRDYLRIDTSREENLPKAVEFWRQYASELGLPFSVYSPSGKPVCIITWQGTDPNATSIMLNSHMDVVAVEEKDWMYPPFSAYVDDDGNIFGRGAQDTKDIAIQYVEAIRRLKENNVSLRRTLHVTLMPDEESGGYNGMRTFSESKEFEDLNLGFALDEGMTSPNNELFAMYQDKRPWQMKFTVRGSSGHGSSMPDDSAAEKLQKLINIISEFRNSQKALQQSVDVSDAGAYSSININKINGGIATNIVPSTMSLVVDMRLAVTADVSDTLAMVNSWVSSAGAGTDMEFISRVDESAATVVDDLNPYYVAMQAVAEDIGIPLIPLLCPARSDMIYVRGKGIPALGFSAKSSTQLRVHSCNEYVHVETFLKGIDIYTEMLKRLGNVVVTIPKEQMITTVNAKRNAAETTGVPHILYITLLVFLLLS